jgi:tRNA threonylcarbamoyladenosine biosynthesis protein TsaB
VNPSPPITLAIETASREGGIALLDAAGKEHLEMLVAQRRHDDALMPAIERLCQRAGLAPGDLQTIGVSLGPGGFTGIRIGVVTAKILADTLGCRLVGVPTAQVLAASATPGTDGMHLAICLAAKQETVWTQVFTWGEGAWSSARKPSLIAALDLVGSAGPSRIVADAHFPQDARAAALERGIPMEPPAYDPRACLRLTIDAARRGDSTAPIDLVPLYPREPEAVTKWRQRRSQAASSDPTE